jgi:hypothetical protein
MEVENSSALFNLLVPLAVAIFTAIFSVWLSVRRFRSERLWETKLRSYSDLLLALHHMKHDTEISLKAEQINADTNTDFYREWTAKHRGAWDEIRKQIDVSELFLSQKSIQLLRNLRSDANKHDGSNTGHLLAMQYGIEKCLPALKAEARKDLRITVHPFWPNYYR